MGDAYEPDSASIYHYFSVHMGLKLTIRTENKNFLLSKLQNINTRSYN